MLPEWWQRHQKAKNKTVKWSKNPQAKIQNYIYSTKNKRMFC